MHKNIGKLIVLSKKKKELLNKILELTKNQSQSIENEKLDDLSTILDEKENLMKEIDAVDKEFLENYNAIKEGEGIGSFDEINVEKYQDIEDLKNIVTELNSILTKISHMDKENTRKMAANIKNVKLDIRNVKKGKKAHKGYNQESVNSILIDEKK